jgi:hypothetical protein
MSELEITIVAGSNLKDKFAVPAELHVLEDERPANHDRMFRILSQDKGDDRITWDSRSLPDIRAAKKTFLDLVKKGLKPFKVDPSGKATTRAMREFDPLAEEVVFLPQAAVAGG